MGEAGGKIAVSIWPLAFPPRHFLSNHGPPDFLFSRYLTGKTGMTAEIVDLASRRPGDPNVRMGNGARDAMIDVALTFNNTDQPDAERWTDYLLAELWARGFKVVPVVE